MTNNDMKKKSRTKIVKIVFVGDSDEWRYNVCSKMGGPYNRDHQLTLGVVTTATDFIEINSDEVKFQIWDIGNQESFAELRLQYYSSAKGAVIVFNATDQESIDNIENWIRELRDEIEDIPICLINYLVDTGEKKPNESNDIIIKKLSEKIGEEIPIIEFNKQVNYNFYEPLILLWKKIQGIE